MENQNDISEPLNSESFYDIDEQFILSTEKFIILSIATLGLYNIWWMYKTWRFYRQKEKSDIMPAARAIFFVFFLYSLCAKILSSAREKDYNESYSPAFLFTGFLLVSLLALLPYPLSLLSIFSFIFIIPLFKAFNYTRENSTEFPVTEQDTFNDRQVILIVIGFILCFLVLVSLNGSFNVSLRTD